MAKSAASLCKNVNKDIKAQAVTLAKAVLALQDKIENQIPNYKDLPLAQTLTTTQGEQALKSNPALQEFRATVRDYASALKDLNILIEGHSAQKVESASALEKLKSRFKAVV